MSGKQGQPAPPETEAIADLLRRTRVERGLTKTVVNSDALNRVAVLLSDARRGEAS